MPPGPETKLVKKIIDRLNKRPRSHARKVHQSRFQSGEPDIDAVVDGRSVKIEVKVPGNTPTLNQMLRMRQWQKAGALVGWVDTVEGADELLGHLDEPGWLNPQLD